MLNVLLVITEVLKKHVRVAPILLYLYPKFQIDFIFDHCLDICPGSGSYLFEHRALLTDDHALMRVFFAYDGGIYIDDALRKLHTVDDHGYSVRNFISHAAEHFFPDYLSGYLTHGLVGHRVLVIEHLNEI